MPFQGNSRPQTLCQPVGRRMTRQRAQQLRQLEVAAQELEPVSLEFIITLAAYAVIGLQESFWHCSSSLQFHDIAAYILSHLSLDQKLAIGRIVAWELIHTRQVLQDSESFLLENLDYFRSRQVKQAAFGLVDWGSQACIGALNLQHLELNYAIYGKALPVCALETSEPPAEC